jgi:hypothetical protein
MSAARFVSMTPVRILGDEELQAIIDLYGTYYALYYSDCRLTDPDLYRWCMRWLAAH